MRVLSLSRPWPWAIFDLPPQQAKRIENRSVPCPRALLGQPIALHAAKSWDAKAIQFFESLGIYTGGKGDHPSGAIVGVATAARVVAIEDIDVVDPDQRRWCFGPWCWLLQDVRKLKVPIPRVGGLGIRILPSEIEEQILADLAGSATTG